MLSPRLLCELGLLDEYSQNKEFFSSFSIIKDELLKVNFKIVVHGIEYEFLAIFPKYFPYQPIIIDKITDFKTGHSYKNGSMCLKWGVDNWDSGITLTKLIDNLYDLLFDENPLGLEHGKSESGDVFSLGQKLLYIDEECIILPYDLLKYVKQTRGTMTLFTKKCKSGKKVHYVSKVDETNLIHSKRKPKEVTIQYVCLKETIQELSCENANSLKEKYCLTSQQEEFFLLFTFDNYGIFIKNDDKPYYVEVIVEKYEIESRSGLEQECLSKKITILGLGSVGSRVALDLARAGFSNFYFVDNDIMLPYNTLRHELTNINVGEYKVYEIKDKIINEINSNVNIDCSTLNILGQESTRAVDAFLRKCSMSDVIIDCTADDNLLLLVDHVSTDKKIPIISGTVIPGGLGNIILYKNANKNVNMDSILASFYQWKVNNNIFAKQEADYSVSINEQKYVATMSDCSILSGLIGKFVIDMLKGTKVELKSINIFSTSTYGDLQTYYTTYSIDVHTLVKEEVELNEDLIEKGKIVYENYYSK
ncbi:MAG: ThiF family adenylyltransferase [Roseburia sp.]|nr:ThiF family adenylyltransferase [Roseburia sp.]MCM1557480.1 ThiF family adenylyltransferase [Anaeroplasma bactoclasticum]